MPLVGNYGANLQSVHGLRCYGNITRTRNVSEYMLVLVLCLGKNCNQGGPISTSQTTWPTRSFDC